MRVADFKPDVVIADYSWLANIFDDLPSDSRILKTVFVHDLRFRVVPNLKQAGIRPAHHPEWTWEKEAELLRKATILLTLQDEDAALLRKMSPESSVIRISVSTQIYVHNAAEQIRSRCLYVASDAEENAKALLWLLREIWPTVLRSRPDANLHVCGTVCRLIDEQFPRTRFLGRVEEIGLEYGAAEVCLVPHIIHGGIKLKLVEALSHGRAVVSSPCGLDGLPEAAGRAALVAETPLQFAEAILRVLGDPFQRRRMEEGAQMLAKKRLSTDAAYGTFVEKINILISQSRIE